MSDMGSRKSMKRGQSDGVKGRFAWHGYQQVPGRLCIFYKGSLQCRAQNMMVHVQGKSLVAVWQQTERQGIMAAADGQGRGVSSTPQGAHSACENVQAFEAGEPHH
eukprot:scaffold60577_cov18-Tisochrysis_lutea.AAC.4